MKPFMAGAINFSAVTISGCLMDLTKRRRKLIATARMSPPSENGRKLIWVGRVPHAFDCATVTKIALIQASSNRWDSVVEK